jgi:hypothetical protein
MTRRWKWWEWCIVGTVALGTGVCDFHYGHPWLGRLGCALFIWSICNAVSDRGDDS